MTAFKSPKGTSNMKLKRIITLGLLLACLAGLGWGAYLNTIVSLPGEADSTCPTGLYKLDYTYAGIGSGQIRCSRFDWNYYYQFGAWALLGAFMVYMMFIGFLFAIRTRVTNKRIQSILWK